MGFGQATKEKLFCVTPAYDLDSETFKTSYLSHEGRHFADYKKFPKLDQPELEYRGKLTELTLANETIYKLVEKFRSGGKNSRKSPHAFANYHVYKNLSFAISYGKEIDWSNVSVKTIQENARKLLDQNTTALERKGANSVREIL